MPQFIEEATVITVSAFIRPEEQSAFTNWQTQLNAQVTTFPGFVSLELLSPSEQHKEWLVILRFNDAQSAAAWSASPIWQELTQKLRGLATENGIREAMIKESNVQGGVTEVLIAEIDQDQKDAYCAWSAKIHRVEAKFPGFRGVYIQTPRESQGRYWLTLLQFDTQANLDHWLQSPERQELLKQAAPLITSLKNHRVISPYAGWFTSIAKIGEAPALWKQTMIILLVLFPIVMMELKYLSPLLKCLDISLATFISNAISVSLISWPMMPIAIYFLSWWLVPDPTKRQRTQVIGTLVVGFLYLIEIIAFWSFF